MTVLEAFAAGRPVIASDLGGLPEQVVHGERGLLFPPGDVVALADALRRVWADQREADGMGENARLAADTEYSPEVHYSTLRGVYDVLG